MLLPRFEHAPLLIDLHAYVRLRKGDFTYEEVLPVLPVMLHHLAKADAADAAYPACMYQAIHLLTDISSEHHARVENVITSVEHGVSTVDSMLQPVFSDEFVLQNPSFFHRE